ncbi:tetratricopeptide [Xylaria sp. FL1777]|nr:tetratricopeptide [Xylaria sp. FL1777]
MSFLSGGPECSTAGNPLSQFAKHTQEDNSLQRDRLRNGVPQRGMGGFRSSAAQHSAQGEQMMNAFFQQTGRLPDMPLEGMGQIRMDPPSHGVHLRANSASPSWANEFQHTPQSAMEAAFNVPQGAQFSPEEFAKFQQMTDQANASRSSPMPSSMAYQRPMMGMGMMNSMGMNYGMMYNRPGGFSPESMVEGKGKGKLVELDDQQWEEQFKQLELQAEEAQEQDEAAALEPELNKLDAELMLDEQILGSETNFGDFESIWKGIEAERAAAKEAVDEEEWVDQLGNPDWTDRFGDWDGLAANSRLLGDPQVEDYLFEDDNLFRDTANPFEEGMRILDEGGNLSLAALAFEAAIQKDPTHVEAWVQLGIAQAQNEKETAAIRALEQAKKLDPNNPTALMTLAVSYTNEGYDSTAYRTLERWLSVRYPSIIAPAELSPATDLGFTDRQLLHVKVTNLFIQAARLSPDGEHMDPDVQVGLGVLFYGAEEYEKAVDCFSSALASSELGSSNKQNQLHLLWNRLGATLANSGKSEDAIAAYEKALTLRSNFVRARYNLGVSCINMGCHNEAAGHLLAALNMHKTVEREGREKARELLGGDVSDAQIDAMTTQNRSTNLYDTLRRVFTQMERPELAKLVVNGVDPEIFRGEIDF